MKEKIDRTEFSLQTHYNWKHQCMRFLFLPPHFFAKGVLSIVNLAHLFFPQHTKPQFRQNQKSQIPNAI